MNAARELFIYYRAKPADAPVLQAQVLAFQQRLEALHPGLVARLLRRPETADGWQTWMETYARPAHPDGVSEVIEQEIARLALESASALKGCARHVEVFRACAS